MQKYLFLDFDGVLHPASGGSHLFQHNPLLHKILDAVPDVQVVFSTSWREALYSLEELTELVTDGRPDLAPRFVGQTPSIRFDQRLLEIEQWLSAHARPDARWLALDDIRSLFGDGQGPNILITDGRVGLAPDLAEAAIRHFD